MNVRRNILMLGMVLFVGLFSACDMLEDVYDSPEVAVQKGQYYIDATDYAKWVYINLHTPIPTITISDINLEDMTEVGAPEQWDIAHHRYDVKTNGATALMTKYQSIDALEAAGLPEDVNWAEDEESEQSITVDMSHMMDGYLVYAPGHKNLEIGKWIEVDTSNMPPAYTMHGNVMLLRFADGTYGAIQLANFMSTDNYQIKGWMTVNYKYPLFEKK